MILVEEDRMTGAGLDLDRYKSDRWWKLTATEHALGDKECGRAWECACGACRKAREKGYVPDVGNQS